MLELPKDGCREICRDQFSKLHPCLPVNTRIAIIGVGPSGLSASYALARLGYSNVTVLEKYRTGGMCESVRIEGQVFAANSAPVIFNVAKEMGSEFEENGLSPVCSYRQFYRKIRGHESSR